MISAADCIIHPESGPCPARGKRTGGAVTADPACPWRVEGGGPEISRMAGDYGDFPHERTDVAEFYEREYAE